MKNTVLIILAITVFVLGGWIIYDNKDSSSNDTKADNENSISSSSDVSKAESKTTLDLSGKGITKVDSSVYGKQETTVLILSDNSINTLPSEMGKMTNVTTFKIDHNLLDGSLIGEIRQMSKLKVLDVSYNKMTGMPAEIGQLSNLETLNYSYNDITGLPNELENLKNNLKEFDLTGNPLSQETITKLKNSLPNTKIIF